ncbi:chemotaxis protein CheD [Halobaculum litoreum]|uniref:Chemotaxis protein CheD n=1 Tax=Halobaculum litoreum TaxID=3031998 RepID=A0ABD5XL21_9EURY
MLPEAADRPGDDEKFVVEGIDALIADLVAAGADRTALVAKVAGAAEMIAFEIGDDGASVGERNVAAAEAALAARDVPLAASDTGGDRGRSLRFETTTGSLHVSYAGGETVVL